MKDYRLIQEIKLDLGGENKCLKVTGVGMVLSESMSVYFNVGILVEEDNFDIILSTLTKNNFIFSAYDTKRLKAVYKLFKLVKN